MSSLSYRKHTGSCIGSCRGCPGWVGCITNETTEILALLVCQNRRKSPSWGAGVGAMKVIP